MEDQLAELLTSYKPSQETIELVSSTPIVLLVGISGAGKDTIKHHLLETGSYHHIVSYTTRPKRSNAGVMEQDGVEYYFVTKQDAVRMLENGEFVEAKEYSGNVYGTSSDEIRKASSEGKIALTDLEVQGVAEYKAISSNVIAVFVLPPNYAEWQNRLLSRYGNDGPDAADLAKRMKTAIYELEEALSKDYYHFVVNDNLADAVHAVDRIAHKKDEFNQIDRSFRAWAEQILSELKARVE